MIMNIALITADITTLAIVVGAMLNLVPAAAGVLAMVYYGFLIYDRIKYGPQVMKYKEPANGG